MVQKFGKFVENVETDQFWETFVQSLLMDAHEEFGKFGKLVMNLLLRQAHDITVKSVNESETAVNC